MIDLLLNTCPPSAVFLGFMGATASLVLSCVGSAIGTTKAGSAVASTGVLLPESVMKFLIPVVMAGIFGIYGLILSILIIGDINNDGRYPLFDGIVSLSAGLTQGLSSLAAGITIGYVGASGISSSGQQPRLFVSMILMLIMAEALALYGVIVCISMLQKVTNAEC
ncbi:hypothetical protein P9112_005780 [Eukaryota sp. TZLM1-RC]